MMAFHIMNGSPVRLLYKPSKPEDKLATAILNLTRKATPFELFHR